MKAYSKDLRQKIVDALERGMPKAQAARTFGVGISTVKRYATKAQRGEPLEPAKAPGKRPKMDERVGKLLEEDLQRFSVWLTRLASAAHDAYSERLRQAFMKPWFVRVNIIAIRYKFLCKGQTTCIKPVATAAPIYSRGVLLRKTGLIRNKKRPNGTSYSIPLGLFSVALGAIEEESSCQNLLSGCAWVPLSYQHPQPSLWFDRSVFTAIEQAHLE